MCHAGTSSKLGCCQNTQVLGVLDVQCIKCHCGTVDLSACFIGIVDSRSSV